MTNVSEIHEHLFHYTNEDGLYGILGSEALWATHWRHLNDFTEITLLQDKLSELMLPHVRTQYEKLIRDNPAIIKKVQAEGGLEKVTEHDTKVLVDAQYSATGEEIFIFSLCGTSDDLYVNNNGLLSQWRGYGEDGGYALVFDTATLEKQLAKEHRIIPYRYALVGDVVYSDDDERFNSEFSEDLSVLAGDVEKLFDHHKFRHQSEELILDGVYAFMNCITRYKHRAFKEENEVRIILLTMSSEERRAIGSSLHRREGVVKEVKTRNRNGVEIPYVDVLADIEDQLPIKRIIVGPHKDKEKRAEDLRKKLKLEGRDIEVTCSDIPYIG